MTSPRPADLNIGICSMQHKPPAPYDWVRFHAEQGVRFFYIGLENCGPEVADAFASAGSRYGVLVRTEHLTPGAIDTSKNWHDIMSRQSAWVNRALELAQGDGVQWLLHIDDDELAYARLPGGWQRVLGAVPAECASVHIDNYEGYSPAQPASSWVTDPGVRYMPRACAHHFAVYANGKSASRTIAGQRGAGPHSFSGGKTCPVAEADAVVLHHDSLATGPDDVPPATWVLKHLLRKGADPATIPFAATRDAIEAVATGDPERMRTVWQQHRSQLGDRYAQCASTVALPLHSYKWV